MILNYKFKNFLSFSENVEFSMLAPKTKVRKRFPNNYVETDGGFTILKSAVIVGENAGGKSNFVKSLAYFKSFFEDGKDVRSYRFAVHLNHIMEKCPKGSNTHQIFEIEALCGDDMIYLYHLEIDFMGISNETLSFKRKYNEKYKLIFTVEREDCVEECGNEPDRCDYKKCRWETRVRYSWKIPGFDKNLLKLLEEAVEKQKRPGLFILKLAVLGNEHAVCFSEWMKDFLCPESYVINADLYKALKNEEEDMRVLKDPRYLEIFRLVDYSITGIELDEEKPFTKTMVIRTKKDGKKLCNEIGKDSSGVSEFFAWALQIFKVVYENKVVFADEMDRVLNPVLSDRAISFLNGKHHRGQFIFTTHNVLHLDLKNYMKEQIYFITKDAEHLESEMYSLADFPEIRYETTKIYEFYMKGILGGTAVE